MENLEPVRNLNTLKAMQKLNLIEFCEQTGKQITGLYDSKKFTCYYIDGEGKASKGRQFTYKNKQYEVRFVSGCFNPYVFEIIT